jgi:hypothetical protein
MRVNHGWLNDITCDGCDITIDIEDETSYGYVTNAAYDTVERICVDCLDAYEAN